MSAFASDGGLPFADAGPPDPATGLAAREVARALCPAMTRSLRASRRRHGCAPDEDDAIDERCEDWVASRYDWMPDSFVLDTGALATCLRAFERDARDGRAMYLDLSCTELMRDAAGEGEPCAHEGFGCGDDGFCLNGRCVAATSIGEPCTEIPCERALFCVAGLCEAPVPRGGPCDGETPCAEADGFCENGRCTTNELGDDEAPDGHCALDVECRGLRHCVGEEIARCVVRPELGQPCREQDECGPLTCGREGVCRDPRPTTPPGPAREGEPCEISAAHWEECAQGTSCTYRNFGYVCVRHAEIGEDCASSLCVEGATCEWRLVNGHCESDVCDARPFDTGEE